MKFPWKREPDFGSVTDRVLDVVRVESLGWLPVEQAERVREAGIEAARCGLVPFTSFDEDRVSQNPNGRRAVLAHFEPVLLGTPSGVN